MFAGAETLAPTSWILEGSSYCMMQPFGINGYAGLAKGRREAAAAKAAKAIPDNDTNQQDLNEDRAIKVCFAAPPSEEEILRTREALTGQ